MPVPPDIFDHIIAVVFGMLIPVLSGYRSAGAFQHLRLNAVQRRQFFISNSLFLWIVCLIILVNWLGHHRSLAAIGLGSLPECTRISLLLTAAFLLLYAGDIFFSIRNAKQIRQLKEEWEETAPFLPVHHKELPAYIFMCFTAAVCEEIIFRGFLLNYTVSNARYLSIAEYWAVIIPAVIFALAHYYQGWKAVFKIAVLSVLFGYIYLQSASLWIVIVLHFAVDLTGGLLSIRYLDEPEEDITNTPGSADDIPGVFDSAPDLPAENRITED